MNQTRTMTMRIDDELLLELKKIAIHAHSGRYQSLIKDILEAYVYAYKMEGKVSRKTREMQRQIRDLVKSESFKNV